MSAPTFRLDEASTRLGVWEREHRCIGISVSHILRDPWLGVLETLRHEMAHQFADEILKATDEAPHGPAFQRACERLRVGAAARGDCDVRVRLEADRGLMSKVEKLLSLATSKNENEAQTAMNKARELMISRRIAAPSSSRTETAYDVVQTGPLKKRHEAWEYQLASILNRFFFVETLWCDSFDAATGRSGTRLELYGTAAHLQMADYVHEYLSRLLPDLWTRYKRDHGIRSNRDRRGYFSGVLAGFRAKLTEQDSTLAERLAVVPSRSDPQLERFYRYINPRIRSVGGGLVRDSDAYRDGVDTGRSVTIQRPLESDGGFQGHLGPG